MSDGGTIFMEQMLANRRAQAIIDAVDDSRYWRDQYDKLLKDYNALVDRSDEKQRKLEMSEAEANVLRRIIKYNMTSPDALPLEYHKWHGEFTLDQLDEFIKEIRRENGEAFDERRREYREQFNAQNK